MKKTIITLLLLLPTLFAACDTGDSTSNSSNSELDSYYADAENLTGDELKAALHTIISTDVTAYSYSELWDQLSYTDRSDDDESQVELLYTGWTYDADDHGGDTDQWNREHVWAKSHGDFGTATGPGTDLHHIRPTDVSVNSARSNLDFDEGGSLYTDGDGETECYYDSDSWEPRDEVKGDVARMIFYMAVRYEGDSETDYGYDLELADSVDTLDLTDGSNGYHGKLSTLLEWNDEDPVSDWEMERNDRIEECQGNRNPFVDYPDWADDIWADEVSTDETEEDTSDDTTTGTGAEGLFISEVVDPGDDYTGRFVELYNAGDSTVDFDTDTYYLVIQSNGSGYSSKQLTGTIAAGEAYVAAYTDATSFESLYSVTPDLASTNLSGNGNDAYFLYYGGSESSGTLVDIYGETDTDGTDSDWEYEDSHAVRSSTVTSAATTWDSTEWTISSADTADMTPGSHN
ncbi:MAG: endonuclease [Spirochaetales bacterium]|nr:endonuclease [Spirochaetales bacterium]